MGSYCLIAGHAIKLEARSLQTCLSSSQTTFRSFLDQTHPRTFYQNNRRYIWYQSEEPSVIPKAKSFVPRPDIGHSLYQEVWKRSIENPTDFWAEQAEQLVWYKRWDRVLDNSMQPFTKWFVGGEMNTCHNAVDRHVDAGNGDRNAIIFDSPVTDTIEHITYRQLLDRVSRFARVLKNHGVKRGDRVLIYMPMIPEAIVAMLASSRVGALHSLVFGGFGSKELSTRICHADPRVIVTANCGAEPGRIVNYKPLLDGAIDMCEDKPARVIIYNRKNFEPATMVPGRDVCYDEEMSAAKPHDCVPVPATDPLYLLYTSGTTGEPKAVVRPSGGHAVVLNWSMYSLYGLKPKETWFAASDLGWIVGHSYIVYAPLLHGNTTVLFEGKPVGTPDPSTYYRVLNQHKVVGMFVAPTAMRALRREDPNGEYAEGYPMDKLKYMFVAGEHCDHETLEWIRGRFKVPVLDNWWQTETGSAITATCVGLGNDLHPPPGMAGKAVPGWNVKVVRKDGSECGQGELGQIVARLPLPPAFQSTLYHGEDRFRHLYFSNYPGYYDTMDSGFYDEDGNIAVMARTDDVINVAGHRLSTGQLEEAILEHPEIAEAAVVGFPDKLKGHVPLGFCVLAAGDHTSEATIIKEICAVVREHVGPVASFKDAVIVQKLPKTRSGKIARNTLSAMVAGKPYSVPITIEDPSVYPDICSALEKAGYKHAPPM